MPDCPPIYKMVIPPEYESQRTEVFLCLRTHSCIIISSTQLVIRNKITLLNISETRGRYRLIFNIREWVVMSYLGHQYI